MGIAADRRPISGRYLAHVPDMERISGVGLNDLARPETAHLQELLRGVDDGTRTRDCLDHNQELYQLSYAHRVVFNLAGWAGLAMRSVRAGSLLAMSKRSAFEVLRPRAKTVAATGAQARGALAIGALAVGAAAVGGFAIGRLSVGRLAIGRARIGKLAVGSLSVEELEIGKLTVREGLPEGNR